MFVGGRIRKSNGEIHATITMMATSNGAVQWTVGFNGGSSSPYTTMRQLHYYSSGTGDYIYGCTE